MTKYELEILRIVSESSCHPTSEDVYTRLKEKYPGVVRATAYNNLNKLSEEGMIRKVVSGQGSVRYDKTLRHDHLVCQKCRGIRDVYLPDMTTLFAEGVGEEITSYDLKINWICPDCRGKN